MMSTSRKRVQLRVAGSSHLGGRNFHPADGVSQTILRGRITREETLIEFELEGEWDAINRTILGLADIGEIVRIWDPPTESWGSAVAVP